ncbi:MAG TPA: TIGR03435 family protein [Terracidiphilus sp.]|nr:TIGR03435 family protein [Terracidiphilus sp.]
MKLSPRRLPELTNPRQKSRTMSDMRLAVCSAVVCTAMFWTEVAVAQPPTDATALEVSTVRFTARDQLGYSVWSQPGIGVFSAHCVTLPFLIHMAYGVDESQIGGKEKWMDSEFFDVVAKPTGNIPLTREQLKPVLQQLLKERFHLATHPEVEPMKGYVLVCARTGSKLQPGKTDKPPGFRVYVGSGRLEGFNWSTQYLASMLQNPAGRPVVDRTGLSGVYDIKLYFAPDLEQESSLPSLFTALHETLGLELKSRKVPVSMQVIDHADRTPTAN